MSLPPREASEGTSGEERRGAGAESSDKPEAGDTPQTTLETNARASQEVGEQKRRNTWLRLGLLINRKETQPPKLSIAFSISRFREIF